jgi:2-polyprenyl-6-methoxyphenol hydroxylase-like FAD-dependent oxidoreductase
MTAAHSEHALVIGGSMAGLLAARTLSEHFDRVTLIDRDTLPEEPAARRGVPQSAHLHILLDRGAQILERWFPGISAELIESGAQTLDWPSEVRWMMAAGWSERFSHGIRLLSCSRHLLEWTVRRRVMALENVTIATGRDVIGLAGQGDAITAVEHRARGRDALESAVERTPADLIVDASGRNSQAPQWLAGLGYDAPESTEVNSFLGYASRVYEPPSDFEADWKAIYLQANPPHEARLGGLFPLEGGQWIVTLGGAGGDYPPTDEEGFLAFARSLRSTAIYDALQRARPVTPIRGYQRTVNQLRHYDRLERFPERFVVLGDALCAFNPIYGQGMTVAAMESEALDRCLRDQPAGLSKRFQKEAARCVADAWMISTGEDLRYPTTVGATAGFQDRLTHRYLDRVIAAATGNKAVNLAFVEVLNLKHSPTSLFHPRVLVPALLGRHGKRASSPAATQPRSPGRMRRLTVSRKTLRTLSFGTPDSAE